MLQRLRALVSLRVSVWVCLLAAGIAPSAANAQTDWFQPSVRNAPISARDNGAMMRLVRPLSTAVRKSVVQVFCGTRVVALGTVVSEDGYVLTKQRRINRRRDSSSPA